MRRRRVFSQTHPPDELVTSSKPRGDLTAGEVQGESVWTARRRGSVHVDVYPRGL